MLRCLPALARALLLEKLAEAIIEFPGKVALAARLFSKVEPAVVSDVLPKWHPCRWKSVPSPLTKSRRLARKSWKQWCDGLGEMPPISQSAERIALGASSHAKCRSLREPTLILFFICRDFQRVYRTGPWLQKTD